MQDTAAIDYNTVLTDNIRAERARRRLTQESLASRMQALGYRWHFQTVGAVERGKRQILASELPALALALETTMEALILPARDGQPIKLPKGQWLSLPAAPRLPYPPDWASAWDGDESRLSTAPETGGN